MASRPLLLVGTILVLAAAHEVIALQTNSMEENELLGLFEVMGSLLEDPNWEQLHPLPCTDTPWPGVQCEISQNYPPVFHVTKIHIGPDLVSPPCKTSAHLPHFLPKKLPFLKTLSVFNCFVKTPVSLSPNLFGTLSSLEHIALKSNPALSGGIPLSLGQVTSLRVLVLSQNNLQGEIPKELGGLVNLEQLDLSYNNLSGEIPQEIGVLKSLTILDLSWNGLLGEVPCSLGQLQSTIQKVDLGSNMLIGMIPPELGKLKRLVLLDLSHNNFNGPIPETLSGMEQLQYLLINDNPINAKMPLFIQALRKLKVLSFSSCGLKGQIPTNLFALKNLTALSLDNNTLNGTVPPSLGALPCLDQLNLSQNQLSGELLLPEEFIYKLGKRLDVRGNRGLCTRKQIYEMKNISFYLETPVCLDTSTTTSSINKSWADDEQPDDDCKRMKISSNTTRLDQKIISPGFLLIVAAIHCFLLNDLFFWETTGF